MCECIAAHTATDTVTTGTKRPSIYEISVKFVYSEQLCGIVVINHSVKCGKKRLAVERGKHEDKF